MKWTTSGINDDNTGNPLLYYRKSKRYWRQIFIDTHNKTNDLLKFGYGMPFEKVAFV